jgi:hypothetical protein
VLFSKMMNQSNNVGAKNVKLVATSKQPHINIKQKKNLSVQRFLVDFGLTQQRQS